MAMTFSWVTQVYKYQRESSWQVTTSKVLHRQTQPQSFVKEAYLLVSELQLEAGFSFGTHLEAYRLQILFQSCSDQNSVTLP